MTLRVRLTLAAVLFLASQTHAQTFTWDTVGNDGTITGGSGVWDAAATGWSTDGGLTNVAWGNTSTSTALFGGTAGTVTVNGAIVANRITFTTVGYAISGGTITLSGINPTITTATGVLGATVTIGSVLDGTSGLNVATSGAFVFGNSLTGSSTVTLNGSSANTFTGGLTIGGGMLTLNYANLAGSTDLINSGNVLSFSGGVYNSVPNATTATGQTFAGLTLNSGSALINLAASGALTNTLTFTSGTITRSSGGTATFVLPTNTSVNWNPALANGIIGPWATTSVAGGQLQYATVSAGKIAGFTGTPIAAVAGLNGTDGTANYDLTATGTYTLTTQTPARSFNTIRYINAGGTATIGGTFAIGLNGIIHAGNGGLFTIATSTGGLQIGSTKELVIFASGAFNSANTTSRNITISSVISDNAGGIPSGITYNGVNGAQANQNSVLTLSSTANSFTGPITINSGTVVITTWGVPPAIGATLGTNQQAGRANVPIILNGGTLRASNGTNGNGGNIFIGANGGTLDVQTGIFFNSGTLTGTGTLNVISSNGSTSSFYMLYTGNSPNFTGNIVVGEGFNSSATGYGYNGGLQHRSNAALPFGTATITVRTGGVLTADNGSTNPSSLPNAIIMQGGVLGQQGVGTTGNAGTTGYTYTGPVTLQTNSFIGNAAGGSTPANPNFPQAGGFPIIITGGIGGSAGFTKISDDVLILPTANTYTGGTTIAQGTIRINNNNALGTGRITFNAVTAGNGSLTANIDATAGDIVLPNNLQTWASSFTFAGTSNLDMGTGAVTLTANSTVSVTNNTLTVGGPISGAFTVTKAGAGTLTLTNNTVGNVSVSAGTLNLTGSNLTSGVIGYSGGTLNLPATPYTIGGFSMTGPVGFTVGAGNTVAGPITVTNGTLDLSAATVNAGLITYSGGALTLPGTYTAPGGYNISGTGSLIVEFNNFTTGPVTVGTGGVLTFTGTGLTTGLVTYGGGTLNLPSTPSTLGGVTVVGAQSIAIPPGNTVSGPITLTAGSLDLSAVTLNAGLITYSGGTLTLPGAYSALGGFAISGTGAITVPTGTNVAGPITVAGGTLNLAGANLAAGLITYSGGTLTLPAAYSAGGFAISNAAANFVVPTGTAVSGPITVSAGTLNLAGANLNAGQITYSGGSLILPATTFAATGLSVSNGLTATLNLPGTGAGLITGTPTLTLAGGANLKLVGTTGAFNSAQTFGNLTIGAASSSTITVDPNNGTGTILTLGNSWTFGNGATLLFDYSSPNTGIRGAKTTAALTGGISGGVITNAFVKDSTGNINFAAQDGSFNIVPSSTPTNVLAADSNNAGVNFSTLNTVYTAGTLSWTNNGLLTARSANALIIDTTLNGGTIDMGGGNVLTLTSNTILVNGQNAATLTGGQVGVSGTPVTINHFGTGVQTIASLISGGAGSLTKNGGGTVVLTGANTYTGGTNINGGTLAFGNGTASIVTGNVPASGNFNIAGGATTVLNFLSPIASAGEFRMNVPSGFWSRFTGAGTLILRTNQLANGWTNWSTLNTTTSVPLTLPSTFTGRLVVETGRVDVTGGANLGATNATVDLRNGSQLLAFTGTYTQNLVIAGNNGAGEGSQPGALRIAGGFAGIWTGLITLSANASILTQDGTATWNLQGNITGNFELELYSKSTNTGITLNPLTGIQNSYGTTAVNGGGIVTLGNALGLSPGSITMRAGTLRLNNSSVAVAGLIGTQGTINNNGTTTASTLTLGIDNGNYSYSSNLSDGSTAALAVTKTGTGTQTLAGGGITYTGLTTVNNGTLALQNTAAFGSNVAFGTSNSPKLQLVTPLAGDTINFTKQVTGGFAGATIEKTGPGTVVLAPAAGGTYAGTLTATAGKLYVNTTNFTTAPSVSVAAGATLGGTGAVGAVTVASGGILEGGQSNTGTLTADSLTFSGTSTLAGALADGVTPFVVSGTSTASGTGTVVLNITGTLPANGLYHFLQYGSLSGGTAPYNFASPTRSLTVQYNPGFIDILVAQGTFPIWTGVNATGGVANWSGGNNWKLNTTNAVTDFLNLDNVVFDDTATGATTVNVASNVNPSSTVFNLNTPSTNYVLQGTGSITGGSVTVNGSGGGSLTVANPNTYTSGTTLNGGTLNINNPSAIGTGTLTINSGTIDNNSAAAITLSTGNPQTWAGDFTFTGTRSLNIGTGAVTMTSNRVVTVGANTLSVGGVAGNGTGLTLTKEGAGTLVLQGPSTYLGATFVNNGMLQLGTGAANVGYVAAGYTINTGATLRTFIAATTSPNGIPPWAAITGNGTLALNSAQPVNGTALWGNLALPLTFTGTLLVENGRVDAPVPVFPSTTSPLGGTTNIDIRSGAQIIFFAGTYGQTFSIAGNGWGEGSFPGALRTAANVAITLTNTITLTQNATIFAQSGSTYTLNGLITGNFETTFDVQNAASTINVNPFTAEPNNYASTAFVGAGTVTAGNGFAFSTGGVSMLGTVTVNLNGSNFTFANLSGNIGTIRNNAAVPMVMTVGTDNTSTTYSGLLANGSTGSFGLTKVGNGTLTLGGANTYTGPTRISAGVLNVATIGNGGTASNLGAASNSVSNLVMDGGTLGYTGATGSSDRGFTITSGVAAKFDVSTNSLTFSGGSDATDGALTKLGNGTLVLTGNYQNTGATTISVGKLYLNGTHSTSAVSVDAGTTFGGAAALPTATVTVAATAQIDAGFAGTGQLSVGTLAFGGTATINVGTLSNYATTPVILVNATNGLSTAGTGSVTIKVASLGTAVVGTTYRLIGYDGAIGGSGYAGFTLGTPLPSRATGVLVNNPGVVALTITAIDSLKWTGAVSLVNGWDTTTQNWNLVSNNSPTTFLNAPADSVVFDDSANPSNTNVVIATAVTPSAVVFNNSINSYSLLGASGIAGATSVVKNGTESLSLLNNNSFTGGLVLNEGTVNFGATQSFGGGVTITGGTAVMTVAQTYTGGTTLSGGLLNLVHPSGLGSSPLTLNGGTIDNTSAAALTLATNNAQIWGGSFTFGGTQNLNLGTGSVTLTANSTVNTPAVASTLTVGGVIGDAGNALGFTKAGPGTLVLSNPGSTYTGTTTVTAGVLSVGNLFANGLPSSIGSGTELAINGGTFRYSGILTGGEGNVNNFNRTITIGTANGTIDVTGPAFVFMNGALSGSGTLTLLSTGGTSRQILWTGDSPAFAGNITVGNGTPNSGWLQYRSNAATPFGTATITVLSGGQFSADTGATAPASLSNNFVLSGGTILAQDAAISVNYSGSVAVTAGTTSTFSSAAGGIFTLAGNITGSGNLNRIGGIASIFLGGDNSAFTGTFTHSATGATMFSSPTGGSPAATWILSNAAGGRFSSTSGGTISLGAFSGVAGSFLDSSTTGLTVYSIGALNTNTAYAGIIRDNLGSTGIEKVGTGKLTLTGANSFTGAASVVAGTLQGSNSLTSNVTVGTGSTLAAGTGTGLAARTWNTGEVTFGTGSSFQTQLFSTTSDDMGQLTSSGNVTFADNTVRIKLDLTGITRSSLAAGGLQSYTVVSAPAGSVFVNSGSLTTSNLDLINNAGGFTAADWSLSTTPTSVVLTFDPSVVPEPATVLGLGAAGFGLAGWVRRRRKQA